MIQKLLVVAVALASTSSAASGTQNAAIVSVAGSTVPIRGWYMQSTAHASEDMIVLSKPGADTKSWYRVGSHGTVMVRFPDLAIMAQMILM